MIFLRRTFIIVILLLWSMDAARAQDDPAAQLFAAIESGDLPGVKRLMETGVDPNARLDDGPTALMMAISRGTRSDPEPDLEVMQALLDAGADSNAIMVDQDDRIGYTPLMMAAYVAGTTGQPEIVQMLLDAGADPTLRDEAGRTPLLNVLRAPVRAATLVGPIGVAELKSMDPEAVKTTGRAALLLVDAGASPVAEADNGLSVLHVSASLGLTDVMQKALAAGVDPNADARMETWMTEEKVSMSPLALAAVGGRADAIRLLLQAGADPNAGVQAGKEDNITPLMIAAAAGWSDVVGLLLEAGVDPNSTLVAGGKRMSALAVANDAGHEEVAALLRAAGAEESRGAAPGEDPVHLPKGMDAETLAALDLEDAVFEPGVYYLTPAQAATAAVTDSTLTVPDGEIPWLAEVEEGAVLWSPQGETWETNFARRVIVIEDVADATVFRTREAGLDDIFASMSYDMDEDSERETPASAAADQRSATAEVTYRGTVPQVDERNLLRFEIAPDCRLRIEGKPAGIAEVRTTVKLHLWNEGFHPDYAESAQAAMVIIVPAGPDADCEQALSDVVEETQVAYREIWDQAAREQGFARYEDYVARLTPGTPNEIRREVPEQIYVISSSI